MKSMFGLVGILLVLAIVGMLVKSQPRSGTATVAPAAAAAGLSVNTTAGATPAQQSRQIEEQVREKVNQAPRAAAGPDGDK